MNCSITAMLCHNTSCERESASSFFPFAPSRRHLNSLLAMNLKDLIRDTAFTLIVLLPLSPLAATSPSNQGNSPPDLPPPPPIGAGTVPDDGWWASQPKEKKMLYTTGTAAALIGIWGLIEWDYGSQDWINSNEGWFENNTKYGGADKAGHFWATYTFSDALTALYEDWGYSSETANTYAALSAWSVQAFMEVADGTSGSQGFAWEDMVVNTFGAMTSVLMNRYPELDRKIDFRVEYVFNVDVNGIFDDYSNHYYSMVVKLDGFDAIDNNILKYLEFHAGYYTRGFEDVEEKDSRSLYGGISFNFSRLLRQNGWEKTGKTLEYIQVPYTVLKASHNLD